MPTSFFFKPIRFLLLVLLSFVFASTAFAANAVRWDSLKQAYFQHIPLDGPVNVFAQDHDDFIWLVAGNTLWRWDAYQLTPAIAPSDQKNLLVQTIKADSDGVLWVGTAKGLFRMSRDSLQMQRVNVQGLNALSIQHLAFDYSGGKRRAFIASVNTLFEWDMGGENIRAHAIAGTQSNRIHALQLNDAGQLWLGTTEGLLQKTISGSVSGNLYRASQWPGNTRVATLFTSQDKKLWIGTTKYGLFSIDKKQQLEKITLPTNKSEQPWVYSINEIRPGILWLGTFGSGIIEYDCEHKTFKTIQHNRLLKTSLHDDNVWTLFRDRRGLIWVGGGQGVNLYDATQSAFINIPGDINAKGISDAKIQSVMAMPDDRLWLGTQKHGIEIINPMQSDIQRIPEGIGGSSNLSSDPIEAMMLTDSKKVLASNNWLTFILDSNSYDAKFLRPEGRAPDGFSSAFASYQGSTWIAGTDGLWRMPDIQSAKAKNVFNSVPGERRIASLLADGDVLWLGTWKGLKQLVEDPAPSFAVRLKSISEPALDQQFITSIAKDKKNRLWLGTSNTGLFFNTREGIAAQTSWRNLTEMDGLPSNVIASVQVDQQGNIWASTSRGIVFVDQESLKVSGILANEGATAAPYIRASGTKNAAGEIIFGGAEGLTIVQPEKWRLPSFKPRIVLTAIETNTNKTMQFRRPNSKSGDAKPHLLITPEINRLTIEFAALDYLAANRIGYRYRLSGFDEDWLETDSMHRAATFTSLAPGTYEMQVQYSYGGHEWQDSSLSLSIEVTPAWYQMGWVRVLFLVFIAWLLMMGFAWRTRRYRERQQMLELKVTQRTAALEGANRLLKEKSFEIEEASLTDPLTGLRNRRFLTQHIDADTSLIIRRYQDYLENQKSFPQNTDLIFYLIDIDNFKRVNDTWGHAAGDAVLIEMRRRLIAVFRDSDYLIRWGGEEFLAVARDTSREKAPVIAERIRRAVIEEFFVVAQDRHIPVSCSIGFAAFPFVAERADAFTWMETLAIADAALYKAKELGRDAWLGFDTAGIIFTDEQIAQLKLTPEFVFKIETLKMQMAIK